MSDACPQVSELERFLTGLLAEEEAARTQQHVASCQGCLDTLHGLQASDTLMEAMRAQGGASARSEDAIVAQLMARLSGQAAPASETGQFSFLASSTAVDEIGRLGGYRILRMLGAGGMGVVFEAEDPRLKRRVALKVMKPGLAASASARQRFLHEAQAVAALEHDHIVAIHEVDEDRGVPFFAMPLLKGETLEDRLGREGEAREGEARAGEAPAEPRADKQLGGSLALPIAEVLRITREIAAGLAAAHAQGLTHRDIKPANIWLEKSGRVKILDFGLARPEQDDAHLTQTGSVAGTPQYMAPEQAAGQPVDHLGDLFSLGCVLYRLLTGRLPFRGPNSMAVLHSLALDDPMPPHGIRPEAPRALCDLTLRLLAKQPSQRPRSAAAVLDSLAKIEQEMAQQKKQSSSPRVLPRRSVIAATLLLLAPLAAWYAPAVYRIATNQGLLVIQTDDPNVKVTVKQNGEKVQIVDRHTGKEVTLKAGAYQLELSGDKKVGLKLETDRFTLTRGGEQIVKIWREPPTPVSAAGPAARPSAVAPSPPPVAAAEHPAPAPVLAGPPGEMTRFQIEPPHFVGSVAFSPDGLQAVTGNGNRIPKEGQPAQPSELVGDFNVRIWDLKTGTIVAQLPGFTRAVDQAAFSSDPNRVLAFGMDQGGSGIKLREWDVASRMEIGNAFTPNQGIATATIDAARRQVLYGGLDGTIRLIGLDPGTPTIELKGHIRGTIAAIAISRDGKFALSGGAPRLYGSDSAPDYALRLWDLNDPQEAGRLEGHTRDIRSLAFSNDGSKALSAGLDALILWDIPARRPLTRTSLHNLGLTTAALLPDARHALTASGDGTLRLWDLETGREVWKRLGPPFILCAALSSDGRQVLVSYSDGWVRLFRLPPVDAPLPVAGAAPTPTAADR